MRVLVRGLQAIGRFFNHPRVRLTFAVVLLVSGICEIADTVLERVLQFDIGVGHGVIIYSVAEIGRILHEVFGEVETASDLVVAAEVTAEGGGKHA